jgi:ribosomal protein S6
MTKPAKAGRPIRQKSDLGNSMEETNEMKPRVYELGFILTPTIADTDLSEATAKVQALIEKAGGTVQTSGTPEYIDLAYQMEQHVQGRINKWTQGYFGWMKFDMNPAATEALKKSLDLEMSIIRYLLTKTDLENTVIFKKPKVEVKRGRDTDQVIDEVALEAETEALEASGELETSEETGELADHEKLPDVTADIAETETE